MADWERDIKSIERRTTAQQKANRKVSVEPEPEMPTTDKWGKPLSGRDDKVKIKPEGLNYGALGSISLTLSYLSLLGAVLLYVDALKNILCGEFPGAGMSLGGICLILWPILMAAALALSGAGIALKRGRKTGIGVLVAIGIPMIYVLYLAIGGPAIDFSFLISSSLPEGTDMSSLDLSPLLTSFGGLGEEKRGPVFDFCEV